jgi:hypothetical protein
MKNYLLAGSLLLLLFSCTSGGKTTSGSVEAKPSAQPGGVNNGKPTSKDSLYQNTKIEPKEAPKPGKGPK